MKTNNHQLTETKKNRLVNALTLASSHKGCTTAAIEGNEVRIWGALDIFESRIIFDISDEPEFDVFRVHATDWVPMPSAEIASAIANRTNKALKVAKIVVENNRLGAFAHEFTLKGGIPSGENLKRLIDDVLIGIVLILEQLEELERESALLKGLPSCPEPILN